jgi:hypothetical protein
MPVLRAAYEPQNLAPRICWPKRCLGTILCRTPARAKTDTLRQSTPNAHATASTCTFACAAKEAIAVSARTRTNGDRQIDPRLRAERLARARAHSCRLFRSAAAMIVAADITAARMRAWGLAPTCWRVLNGDWQEPGRWQIETAPEWTDRAARSTDPEPLGYAAVRGA